MTRRPSPAGPILILALLGAGASFVGVSAPASREARQPVNGIPVSQTAVPGASIVPAEAGAREGATGTAVDVLLGTPEPSRESAGRASRAATPTTGPRLTALPSKAAQASPRPAVKHVRPAGVWLRAIASSYGIGDGFLGKRMACGGALTADDLTVAHKTLPCGTRVTFRFRGHIVTATVRDRGPYVAGRTWDFGPAVARALHFNGLGYVEWHL